MATFRYRAIGPSGDVQTGMMDAATEAEVVAHLQRQGSMPLRAEPTERESWLSALWHAEFATGPSLRQQETADIMRELATMLSAGQDLDHAFRYLHETAPNARVRTMAAGLRDSIRDGSPLADALARYPRGFSRMHVALVRAGEASGQLAPTLSRLADLLERQKRLATSVASALIYPCLLIVVAIGAITLLLTEVLPQFVPLFDQSGAQLPASTQFLIASGAFISQNGVFMLLGVAALVLLLRAALRVPRFRLSMDRMLLRLPIVGGLLREILAARFTRVLGTLLVNGVSLIAALAIRARCGRQPCGHGRGRCRPRPVRAPGLDCPRPLAEARVFPPRTTHLLRLGEENAELGPMALRAADIHDERTRVHSAALGRAAGPGDHHHHGHRGRWHRHIAADCDAEPE